MKIFKKKFKFMNCIISVQCNNIIVELQCTQYNRTTSLVEITRKFCDDDNGPDADYCFENLRYKI